MRIIPNKAIINDYLIENYTPKTVMWKSDYDLTIEFNEDERIFIVFDDCDFNASKVNVVFEPNRECENSDEIIDGLNKLRKKSGIDYIDVKTTFRNFWDENKPNFQRHYEYLKSVMEDNKSYVKDELSRFLDRYGNDIHKILPDFSLNKEDWGYNLNEDYYYLVDAYMLKFKPTEVELRDIEDNFITSFEWGNCDE
ncbi:hypothetical protein [Lactobacillus mulieris]|uniref:hypothetical protein n=1 Tax=Lactobacillus mulieris TaxID=2508708 RepID=UPI000A3F545D|nr:hypothetical protein [Lactobacillus mulieris]MCZ3741114.1 hypothetical protein [Lactobacillus mulieris]MCZ3744833.1 hypothetical protein [Lactobacillus mulieris]MCZ3747952.1 hypothetical protein [Lactobacillus mulieris]MCZ3749256.1 hypothetical protein [Lactobacillus mulieris]